jgi:hypothetical protein
MLVEDSGLLVTGMFRGMVVLREVYSPVVIVLRP